MKFITIPHELMPARANINKKEIASTIAEIEGWGYKDIIKIGKIAALRGWNYKNLTKLPKNSEGGLIKFNPSISLLKQSKNFCDYLMWYRATQPCKTTGKRPTKPRMPPYNSTMWDTDWNLCWDGAGICKLRVFNDGRVKIKNDMVPIKETTYLLDARLVFWRNSYHVIYNRYTKNRPYPNSNPELENCAIYTNNQGLCYTMESHPIKITNKGIYSLDFPRVLCRDKHSRYEKNWSIVLPVENKRLIHYSFTPQMKFLVSDHQADVNNDKCQWIVSPNSGFFMKLFTYYKSVLPPLVANGIAVTTPLIDFDSDTWIGIGRIKVSYKKMDLDAGKMKNTKLGQFMNLLRIVLGIPNITPAEWFKYSEEIHADLLYFSFFYTVNKKTLAIDKFSYAYLPQSPDVDYFASITFPVAIQPFTKGNFAISLGIADIDCGIMTMSKKEIKNMLIYSNKTNPKNFDFKILNFENPLPPFA